MELERFGTMHLTYDDGFVLVQPHGTEDGNAYGSGTGRIDALGLSGGLRWSNHPRRRGDGSIVVDAAGLIESDGGAVLVFRLSGRTVWIEGTSRGAQVLQLTLETADDALRWLNDAVLLFEGEIDTADGSIDATLYRCHHRALAATTPGAAT